MTNKWIIDLEEAKDDSGDLIMPLPQDLLDSAGWKEGDVLTWKDLGDGTWSLTKQQPDVTIEEEEAWKELEKKSNVKN
jgi:hypothetical protein